MSRDTVDSSICNTSAAPVWWRHCTAPHRIAERNVAEVGRVLESYFRDRDSLEPVSREELLQRSRAGTVTVLDVRPEDEFALGHLPGAANLPLRALEAE